MGEFTVHHVRFFEYKPKAVTCICYEKSTQRVAASRIDGSIEIWSAADNFFQEKVIPGIEGRSIEGLVWLGTRLFSAGLEGNVVEYDLLSLLPKSSASSSAGSVWCLTKNEAENQLAAGTEDGCVVLFDAGENSLQYLKTFEKQEGRILCIAWHAAEAIVVTGGIDNIRIWSSHSGRALQRLTLGRQDGGKETTVWCLGLTSDLTIISGDSTGKTIFWNGKTGTMIKSIQSHKADVLTVSVDEQKDETNVYSSGVDPSVVRFTRIEPESHNVLQSWVRTSVFSYHTHDVHACAVAGDKIVSGGADTVLICCETASKKARKILKLPAIPMHSMVSVAKKAKLLLLRFPTCLELWRLGHTNSMSNVNGDILQLHSKPLKLLELSARKGEVIVCSTVSSDGTIIAFSDQEKIRVHKLTLNEISSHTPSVEVSRLSVTSKSNTQAHRLIVTPNKKHIIAATSTASVQVWQIHESAVELLHTAVPCSERKHPFTVLAVSDNSKYAATANTGGDVHLYNIDSGQVIYALPNIRIQATTLGFSAGSCSLFVAYSDHSVYEFDISKREYTAWSRDNSQKFPIQWLKQRGTLRYVACPEGDSSHLILNSEHDILVIDRSQKMPEKNYHLFNQNKRDQEEARPLIACSKYKFILHMELLSTNSLVVVERTPMAIQDSLPPTLRQKKFGT